MDPYELLVRELGSARVVRSPEALEVYGRDESGLGFYPPEAAALCESRAEIELVLRLAAEHRIPVTPRGAGSGMTGGALPVRGGIVLSTERMKRILEISVDDRIAVVEPGVINADLQAAAEAQQMFYAPDPASLGFCSMGGNVAENAGGPRAFKYGVTRDWTLGLTVTLMGGETMRLGRRTPKGVTGYDLTALFVGSEGTFGVTSEITVRLVGKPEGVGTFIAVMPDAISAGRAVSAIIRKGYRPRALELLDRDGHRPRARRRRRSAFPADAGAIVLVELDGEPDAHGGRRPALRRRVRGRRRPRGDRGARRRRSRAALEDAAAGLTARCARRTPTRSRRTSWCRPARSPRCCAAQTPSAGGRSCSWRPSATPATATCTSTSSPTRTTASPRSPHASKAALAEIFRAALDLGGTLSGEHGIGIAKARYMAWEQSAEVLGWQRRIKRLWDPKGLLNPGKIFPD